MKTVKGELKLGRFLVPYRIYGEAQKTIICISGAKQTMAAWRSFVSHFINEYSVVVFDLPGQGRDPRVASAAARPGGATDRRLHRRWRSGPGSCGGPAHYCEPHETEGAQPGSEADAVIEF